MRAKYIRFFCEIIKMIMLNYDFLWELWKAVGGTNEMDQSLFTC